jgi:hypothetical protein
LGIDIYHIWAHTTKEVKKHRNMTTKEFHALIAGTFTYTVNLTKDGASFVGVYNGQSFWGKVFSESGGIYTQIEQLTAEFDEDGGQPYNFREADFSEAGYTIA